MQLHLILTILNNREGLKFSNSKVGKQCNTNHGHNGDK